MSVMVKVENCNINKTFVLVDGPIKTYPNLEKYVCGELSKAKKFLLILDINK